MSLWYSDIRKNHFLCLFSWFVLVQRNRFAHTFNLPPMISLAVTSCMSRNPIQWTPVLKWPCSLCHKDGDTVYLSRLRANARQSCSNSLWPIVRTRIEVKYWVQAWTLIFILNGLGQVNLSLWALIFSPIIDWVKHIIPWLWYRRPWMGLAYNRCWGKQYHSVMPDVNCAYGLETHQKIFTGVALVSFLLLSSSCFFSSSSDTVVIA